MSSLLILKFPLSSRFGGGEKHTLDLVSALKERGYVVHLVSSCHVLVQEFRRRRWAAHRVWAGIEPVTAGAILVFPIFVPFLLLFFIPLLLYYRIVRRVKVVYCLSLTEKVLVPLIARCLGMRVVFMEHRLIERWLTRNPLRVLYALQAKVATTVTISRAVADQLIHIGVPEKRLRIIPIGIDIRPFPWPRVHQDRHGAFIIGTVAGLEQGKGIAHLLKAMVELREHISSLRLLVVGNGPERKNLMWLSSRLGLEQVVQWVGFQREAQRWYNHFDVFVLPSVKPESFGIVVIEAMAAGVPVIATKHGGVVEIIEDGKTGYLVPPRNAHEIAEKILYLYYHRERVAEFSQAGRRVVEERFRHDAMIRSFIKLFEDMLQ